MRLLDAYVDGELDIVATLELERHLDDCQACRIQRGEYEALRQKLQARGFLFEAPQGLENRLRARLRTASKPAWGYRVPALAASLAALALLAGIGVFVLRGLNSTQLVAQEIVSCHIRSLMANHLTDVLSSDQHTVKPWFSGKVDFAPAVKDLGAEGFTLEGGRLDYLSSRPVAALVYSRRQHTINLFLWPSGNADSAPRAFTIRGYNLVHWTRGQMTYWAVSDLNAQELKAFAQDQLVSR
ncbi:MAG: anti-sigma factor [Acidobacteriaceae bacterium]|nr:anti-sigma factor [Acidobacteriaceae bacterium]